MANERRFAAVDAMHDGRITCEEFAGARADGFRAVDAVRWRATMRDRARTPLPGVARMNPLGHS